MDRCQISRQGLQRAGDKGRIDPEQCQMAEHKCQISRQGFQMAGKGRIDPEQCQSEPEAGVEEAKASQPEERDDTARKLQNKANSDRTKT